MRPERRRPALRRRRAGGSEACPTRVSGLLNPSKGVRLSRRSEDDAALVLGDAQPAVGVGGLPRPRTAATPDPGAAARAGWLEFGRPLAVAPGVSRLTWALAEKYLTAWEQWHEPELRREAGLLEALDVPGVATPSVVATTLNTALYADGKGWIWMMTQALPGRPGGPPADSAQCEAAAVALAAVHRALAALPVTLAVRRTGPVDVIRTALVTDRPSARGRFAVAIVEEAKAWLSGHLGVLEQSPTQLIHGDWKLGNLRFERAAAARVSGALDFERCSVAPVAIDMVQLLSGALRSPVRRDVAALTRRLVRRYQLAGGEFVSDEALAVALVAYWLDNWLWLEARLKSGEARLSSALARQPARLAAALRLARLQGQADS